MKQEDKELILRDLCARLPYGVKIKTSYDKMSEPIELRFINPRNESFAVGSNFTLISGLDFDKYDCKPYLYPLSSMTEEQYESLDKSNCAHSIEYSGKNGFKCLCFKTYSLELIDWFHKNHFDYRGLIEKGLAIDCTNLDIY